MTITKDIKRILTILVALSLVALMFVGCTKEPEGPSFNSAETFEAEVVSTDSPTGMMTVKVLSEDFIGSLGETCGVNTNADTVFDGFSNFDAIQPGDKILVGFSGMVSLSFPAQVFAEGIMKL